ncbi:MAG: hypothetical protein IPH63_08140 [Flavobacteriales bacterium]|nr:hypothetical protein [Flavobacteriales bacterium]
MVWAKGGSGDVLTGLLTGILAQGYTALEACDRRIPAWFKKFASSESRKDAMRPSDVLEFLLRQLQASE